MPLQEDARALDILRGVDAGALQRCNDTVRLGLVLQVLHPRLALLQLLPFIERQVALLDVLEDAVLLVVLALSRNRLILQRFNAIEDEWIDRIELR